MGWCRPRRRVPRCSPGTSPARSHDSYLEVFPCRPGQTPHTGDRLHILARGDVRSTGLVPLSTEPGRRGAPVLMDRGSAVLGSFPQSEVLGLLWCACTFSLESC